MKMHEKFYGQKLQESTHYVRTPEGVVTLKEQQTKETENEKLKNTGGGHGAGCDNDG